MNLTSGYAVPKLVEYPPPLTPEKQAVELWKECGDLMSWEFTETEIDVSGFWGLYDEDGDSSDLNSPEPYYTPLQHQHRANMAASVGWKDRRINAKRPR